MNLRIVADIDVAIEFIHAVQIYMTNTTCQVSSGARVGRSFLLLAVVLGFLAQAYAQSPPAVVVDEGVWLSIERDTLRHLRNTGQITREEYQRRDNEYQVRNSKYLRQRLSNEQWQAVRQEVKNRLAVEMPLLQQQWNAEAARLKAEADALRVKRSQEMEADVEVAAQLQTDRVFRLRYLQQNKISAADAEAQNATDANKIAALQQKYTDYGGNWPRWFNDKLGNQTEKLVKARDLKERLTDTTSEVGKDVQSAVQISQAIKRNEIRRAIGAIDLADLKQENTPLESALTTLKAKYDAGGPLAASSRDFNERVETLDRTGRDERHARWEREARAEFAAKQMKPVSQPSSPATPGHIQTMSVESKQPIKVNSFYRMMIFYYSMRDLFPLTTLALLFLIGLGIVGCVREMRSFGLEASDPFMIRAGWSSYKIHSITGTVLAPTKSRVVTTEVSGGGSYVSGGVTYTNPVSTSTSTAIHDQFFLRASDGVEEAIQLTNFNLALREGHQMTAAWAIKKGKKSGNYFLFRNHSTRDVDFSNLQSETIMRPSILIWLPVLSSVVSAICYISFHGPVVTEGKAIFLLFYVMLGALLGVLLIRIVCSWRVGRFKREVADRLIPILDQRAVKNGATPPGPANTSS